MAKVKLIAERIINFQCPEGKAQSFRQAVLANEIFVSKLNRYKGRNPLDGQYLQGNDQTKGNNAGG